MLSLIGHPREDEPGFFVNFAVNQEDSGIGVRIASARDLDSFPERGWPEPRWDPILTTPRSLNLARARYLFCARALLLLSLG